MWRWPQELDCTITVLAYDTKSGALGPELQTVSTLPAGYDNDNHSSGAARNAEGGPASGPNSSGKAIPQRNNALCTSYPTTQQCTVYIFISIISYPVRMHVSFKYAYMKWRTQNRQLSW